MIINTVTKKLYDGDKGILCVPCYYKFEYVEWESRGTDQKSPVNYYPANFKTGSTSASKSQKAMQELQDSIVIGLMESPQGFTLEEATLQAENLAPIFARQAFGPGSDERKLSGIDLMQKSDIKGAISE